MRKTICRVLGVVAMAGAAVAGNAGVAGAGVAASAPCERGEFCLWTGEEYAGPVHRLGLENANAGECVPLPDDFDGRSFANRTDRLVTVYQDRDCDTQADFTTYPGGGTFVPAAPFVVRGVQIWET